MRILLLHSDKLKFEITKKALKDVKMPEQKKQEFEDCLAVFWVAEEGDKNTEQIAENAFNEIKNVASQVNEKKIVLYPYVHLLFGGKPASMSTAVELEKKLEEKLKKEFEVAKAPFGFYKSFNIKVKGHPLSELSRVITSEEETKTREEAVEKIKKEHYILTPEGKEIKVDLKKKDEVIEKVKKLKDISLERYILSEELEGMPHEEPPSIKTMRKLELVDYEPAADAGHFRFYPKGNLVYELLIDWAYEIATKRFGAMTIETPLIYDWSQPDIREQGESFHERHYVVHVSANKAKEWVLRFAGDFGLFRIMKNANMSYRNLPARIYELSKSFRYERSGELTGLRRLRGFTMPDVHSFCKDLEEGWEEYKKLYKQYDDLLKGIEIEYTIAFRIVKEFYDKYKDQIIELLKYSDKPAFIEILDEMKHYWCVKHEFQGIDSVGGNCQISTVQLDVKDAKTYGITYKDKDGKEKGCIICHSSVGAIERLLYAILEESLKKKNPVMPLWLSPTQVRLCPVSDSHLDFAREVADKLEYKNIRVEIDDRTESVQKKIRDGELDWVPLVVVVGDKEKESNQFPVRFRGQKEIENKSLDEIISYIKERTNDKPYRPLPVPREMTKQVKFVG